MRAILSIFGILNNKLNKKFMTLMEKFKKILEIVEKVVRLIHLHLEMFQKPKPEVLLATGGYLKSKGYDIRVLNLVNLEESDGYNPFRYIRDEKDALRLVNNLIQATTPKGSHESDPFWTKAETALLQAIILMLWQEAPEQVDCMDLQ